MYPNFSSKAFFSINWYSLMINLFDIITFHLILYFMNVWIFQVCCIRHIGYPKNHIAFSPSWQWILYMVIRDTVSLPSPSESPKLLTVNLWQIWQIFCRGCGILQGWQKMKGAESITLHSANEYLLNSIKEQLTVKDFTLAAIWTRVPWQSMLSIKFLRIWFLNNGVDTE